MSCQCESTASAPIGASTGTFFSAGMYDPNEMRRMVIEELTKIAGEKIFCWNGPFELNNGLELDERIKDFTVGGVHIINVMNLHNNDRELEVGIAKYKTTFDDNPKDVWIFDVAWGDSGDSARFSRESDKAAIIKASSTWCGKSLPSSREAFPKNALIWEDGAKRFFSDEVAKRLKLRKVAAQIGLVCSGPPGNGKSMFVRRLESELGMKSERFSPSTIGEAVKNGDEISRKGIIVFDDVEELLLERSDGDSSCMLPWLLDQADAKDMDVRRLLVIVTNHPEKLDDALLRPGRFDTEIKFGRPSIQQLTNALRFHMEDEPIDADTETEIVEALEKIEFLTLAHVALVVRNKESGFADSWVNAVLLANDQSAYRGTKRDQSGNKVGF